MRRTAAVIVVSAVAFGLMASVSVTSADPVTSHHVSAYVGVRYDNTIVPVDTSTNTAGTPIAGGAFPIGVAITPDGKTLFTADQFGGTVTPIDLATGTPGPAIDVGAGEEPQRVAITPNGKTVYVTLGNEGNVVPIDVSTRTVGARSPPERRTSRSHPTGRPPMWRRKTRSLRSTPRRIRSAPRSLSPPAASSPSRSHRTDRRPGFRTS